MLGMQEAKKRKFCHFYEIMICVESLRHRSLQRHLDDITCPINNEPKVLCVVYVSHKRCPSSIFFSFCCIKIISLDVLSLWYNVKIMIFTKKKLMELQIVQKSAQSFEYNYLLDMAATE